MQSKELISTCGESAPPDIAWERSRRLLREEKIAVETVKSLRQYGLKLLRKEMPLELWVGLAALAG